MAGKTEKARVAAELEDEGTAGEVTREEIEARAYEIHLAGGEGSDVENWLQAERELLAERESRLEGEPEEEDDDEEVEQEELAEHHEHVAA